VEAESQVGLRPSRIVRGAATFLVASVLQRAIPFLLLPLFVRFLTPAEFGQIAILTTVVAAFGVVVGLGLETAVFRGYVRAAADKVERGQYVRSVGTFAIAFPLVVTLVVIVLGTAGLSSLLNVPPDATQLALLGAALNTAAVSVPLALLRASERLRTYLQLTGVQVVITPLLTIVFVVILGWGPVGWMLAYAVGSAALLVRGLLAVRDEWRGRFDAAPLRNALALGLPLVPHHASHWALAASDRALLGAFVPAGEVGAYYAAFLLALPVNVIAIAISQATQPVFADASDSTDARSQLGSLSRAHAAIVAWGAAVVALIGPPIIHLGFPPEYAPAADYVPWLALGAAFFGIYLMPMNAVSITAGRTRFVWSITATAASVNVALNLLLVPRIGTLAAAINTTIGYGILLIGVFLYSRAVCKPPIRYELRKTLLELVVILSFSIVGILLVPGDSALGLIARIGVAALITAAGFAIGPFRHELQTAAGSVRTIRSRGNP
jgi:O-antigen/teichoic acid export membrane protein